jgi:hypothetical protein
MAIRPGLSPKLPPKPPNFTENQTATAGFGSIRVRRAELNANSLILKSQSGISESPTIAKPLRGHDLAERMRSSARRKGLFQAS